MARARQRFPDGFAGDELLAHHPHREIDSAADHRLAHAGDDSRQRGAQPGVVDAVDKLPGDDQSPGGGIDEQRPIGAEMRLPVALGHAVADQGVARAVVGNAQQRLGEAHQRHAFAAR